MKIETVVVAISGAHADDDLSCRVACDIALKTGASLHLVHAWNVGRQPISPYYVGTLVDAKALESHANEVGQRAREHADTLLGRRTLVHIEEGRPQDVLIRIATDVGADLLVVRGNVRHGSVGAVMGSVSEHVIHHATCPTLLLHGDLQWPPSEVVVCCDGSAVSEYALTVSDFLATAMALPLRSARVINGKHQPHLSLEERPHSGPVPRPEVLRGNPADELHRFLGPRPPALVAMGTSGKGTVPLTQIGSVATHLMRTTSAAMLVVPPQAVPELQPQVLAAHSGGSPN